MADLGVNVEHDFSRKTKGVLYPHPDPLIATLLFPIQSSTQYGGPSALTWIVVKTNRNATLKWDTTNVPYGTMANTFFNTGAWTHHVQQFTPAPTDASWPTYTYYFAGRDDSTGEVTATQSVTFTVDGAYPGTVARNLYAIALSDTRVKVQFQDPTDTSTTTGYKIYRNGVQIYSVSQFGAPTMIDSALTANTVYSYTASVALNGVEQAQSPAFYTRTLPSGNHATNSGVVLKLEDFENGLPIINPAETDDWTKYLYNNYPFGDNARIRYSDAVISAPVVTPAKDGTHAFHAHMTGLFPAPYTAANPLYFTMYPFTDDNVRHFAREYIKTGVWAFNTFNRLRFWVKTPPDWPSVTGGHDNFEVGTFVRSSHGNSSGAAAEESGVGGNHFYHHFNIPHTDTWYQIIVDTHVTHQRGASGSIEWTNHAYFSGEPTWNYFDALSRWYADFTIGTQDGTFTLAYPDDFYLDDIEFFNEDESTTDIDHVYSVHGGFDIGTSTVFVGWSRPKDDITTKMDVVYAFSDLYALGFNNGTVFPGTAGGVSPGPDAPYPCLLVSSNAITLGGNTAIYVGIRAQGDTGFRQIVIPLS